MKKMLWMTVLSMSVLTLPACSPKSEMAQDVETAATANDSAKQAKPEGAKQDVETANAAQTVQAKEAAVAAPDLSGQQKVLVAYFSASGTTAGVAKKIGEVTGGTLFEIVPETKYTDEDLDWRNEKSRSSVEMKDPSSRPPFTGKVDNFADYHVIYLGFPIWWNVAPHVVNTFLEAHDMKGKVVVPFCTAGSSSIDNSVVELRKALPDSTVLEGKKWFSSTSKDEIAGWIHSLNIQ